VVARCCLCKCRSREAGKQHKPRGRNHDVLMSGAGSIVAGVIDYATNHDVAAEYERLERGEC
jgi:hypothetical protein